MKLRNSLLLLLTATIWGVAFVAQSVGMQYVGPMTYVCSRSIIGGVVLLPVIAVLNRNSSIHSGETPQERRKGRKILLIGGACCGLILSIASTTQQIALLYIPVGKAGFLTACYILIVPLLGLLFGRKCGLKHWCGVALALLGLYFLCMAGGSLGFAKGDLIGLACALLFSVHILVIDHFFAVGGRCEDGVHSVLGLRTRCGCRHADFRASHLGRTSLPRGSRFCTQARCRPAWVIPCRLSVRRA